MSYYFVKMGINSRSSGGSALRRSAYQRCAKDPDFDFSSKADEFVDADVMLPEGANPDFKDPVALWTSVEAKENRINSQLCRTFEISIPNEVPHELRSEFARELLQPFVDHGLPVEWAIHQEGAIFEDVENPHISAAIAFRQMDENGWAKNKDREMNRIMRDDPHKKFWVPAMNAFFEKHGIEAQVEHKSQHMPEASKAVRRLAKEWKRNGADPDQIPGPVAKFIAHREAHLEILKQEIDMHAEIEQLTLEIETLEKEIPATSKPEAIEQEINDGSRRLSGTTAAERTIPRREDEPGTGDPGGQSVTEDRQQYVENLGADPAVGPATERRPDARADDPDFRSFASSRGDTDRSRQEAEGHRRDGRDDQRLHHLKRRIAVNQTASLMQRLQDAVRPRAKEASVLERIKRAQVVNQTASLMQRIKDTLKPKVPTALDKIRRTQAVAATEGKMQAIRNAMLQRHPAATPEVIDKGKDFNNAKLHEEAKRDDTQHPVIEVRTEADFAEAAIARANSYDVAETSEKQNATRSGRSEGSERTSSREEPRSRFPHAGADGAVADDTRRNARDQSRAGEPREDRSHASERPGSVEQLGRHGIGSAGHLQKCQQLISRNATAKAHKNAAPMIEHACSTSAPVSPGAPMGDSEDAANFLKRWSQNYKATQNIR